MASRLLDDGCLQLYRGITCSSFSQMFAIVLTDWNVDGLIIMNFHGAQYLFTLDAVLGRVKDFLGVISKANGRLEIDAKVVVECSCSCKNVEFFLYYLFSHETKACFFGNYRKIREIMTLKCLMGMNPG